MAELRELQRKLESIQGLREVVNAMRNLAAVYVRRAEATLRAIRPYAEVVNDALRVVLDRYESVPAEPPGEAPTLAVLFASDQGLAGAFNERIVARAVEFRDETQGEVVFVAIGLRGANLLAMRGVEPKLSARMPASLEGIAAQVPELAAAIFGAYSDSGAREAYFVFNAFESMGRFRECARRIIPPVRQDLSESEQRAFTYEPILTAAPDRLLPHMVEEYFFIELYRSLLESHASENGARLASMTAAATNVDDRLEEVRRDFHSVRQDAITSELMDVVSGAEALRSDGRDA